MRLYKTNYIDHAAEVNRQDRACWSGTQAEAASDRKRLKAEGMVSIVTLEEDVPTDKKGLLQFLSMWAIVR